MRKILLILILIFPQIAFAKKFKVNCNVKDGLIYVLDTKTGVPKSIGKTPLDIPLSRLEQYLKDGNVLQLSVEKDGFKPFSILIPVIKDTDLEIYADLDVENDIKMTQDIDLMVADLFDALRMIRLKDLDSAIAKLDALAKKFPHFSIIYEMKATSYYLNKEFKRSLNFYRKAFGMNPKNREAYKMKIYLEKKFKINPK